MNSEEIRPDNPAADRAALREELRLADGGDRLRVFDALDREAGADEEVPEMPGGLRDQLVERFGDRAQQPAAVAPAGPGLIGKVVACFQAKPLASFGGLVVAACAVMIMMVVPFRDVGDGGSGRIDQLRGGSGRPAVTADVPVYLFPEAGAAAVAAMMAEGRKVVVCQDAADFESRLDVKWAVAIDLDRRVVITIKDGDADDGKVIGGNGARGVLLGIRAALDAMMNL